MASFKIQWRNSTKKDIRKLHQGELSRIVQAVADLSADPFPVGVDKLTGSEHTYRIRIGDYRVVYEVFPKESLLEIQRVKHRKDVYRH